jgi:hypothetical protein
MRSSAPHRQPGRSSIACSTFGDDGGAPSGATDVANKVARKSNPGPADPIIRGLTRLTFGARSTLTPAEIPYQSAPERIRTSDLRFRRPRPLSRQKFGTAPSDRLGTLRRSLLVHQRMLAIRRKARARTTLPLTTADRPTQKRAAPARACSHLLRGEAWPCEPPPARSARGRPPRAASPSTAWRSFPRPSPSRPPR